MPSRIFAGTSACFVTVHGRCETSRQCSSEILAEHAPGEIRSPEVAFPVAIGVDLIDHDRALLAAVALKIDLPISCAALDRILPNRCSHGFPLPLHETRQPDIDRNDGSHMK